MNKKNKMKILYILQNRSVDFYEQNKNNFDTTRLFDFLDKNFDYYIINISNILKKNSAIEKKIGKFNFFTPKNINDLSEFVKDNNVLAFVKIPMSIQYYKIF